MNAPLLKVDDLHIALQGDGAPFNAVENVSFEIGRGEAFGLVGESGCGKSITALAVMGLLRRPLVARRRPHRARRRGDPGRLGRAPCAELRGSRIAMIFQEPMTALNPLSPVGRQIAEMFVLHQNASWNEAMDRAEDALRQVRVPSPERRIKDYPAPAFRRHAPARDDRHCAGLPARPADRRRADHGARRHGAGRDHRPDGRALRRQGHRHPDDQPRSRPGRQHVPARRRDVCRPHRRKPGRRGDLRHAAPSLHARAWSIPCRGWASARGAASSGCARSRASCPPSWPTPRAAASIRAARR